MFSQHIDLNDPAIGNAIADVRSNSPTNWVVCGYVPREARIRVVATGNGGVDEMLYELSDGKIHFCYLRYEMSETFKFVFITWCGEGVTGQSKALFSNHSRDFEDYLKKSNFAFAAQINARNETDLEEANIVKTLNKTSTFIRAATTQEKRAQPQTTLMDKRTNYWNKQQEIDQQHKSTMDQRRKENEAKYGRSREEEQNRLSAQSNRIMEEQDRWRQQRAGEWQARNDENARALNSRQEQQRSNLYSNQGAPENSSASSPSTWKQREEVPRAAGFGAFSGGGREPQREPPSRSGGYNQPAAGGYGGGHTQPAAGGYGGGHTQPAAGGYGGGYNQPADTGYGGHDEQPADSGYGGGYDQPADTGYGGGGYDDQPADGGYDQPADGGYDGGYDQPADGGYDQPNDGGYGGGRQVRALFDCAGEQDGDLAFNAGDIINILDDSDPDGWWRGELNGNEGVFPMNFVEEL